MPKYRLFEHKKYRFIVQAKQQGHNIVIKAEIQHLKVKNVQNHFSLSYGHKTVRL